MATLLLLHGPNLNLLGERDPAIYGATTLAEIENSVRTATEQAGHRCLCFQANSEGAMIDWLQSNRRADFLLINAGAYTHTSIALRDAIADLALPFLEIHLSNIYKRESFRHHSHLADLALGTITGLGARGYRYALDYALAQLAAKTP